MLRKIWFASEPKTTLATKYIQSSANLDVACMTKRPFQTLVVDMLQPHESILAACTPNCRNEIRKGLKIGMDFCVSPTEKADADFVDCFLRGKHLGGINRAYVGDPKSVVCTASLDGRRMATHLYFVESAVDRVRLVYSAVADPAVITSQVEVRPRRLIGIANRFLHYSAMLHFKKHGFKIYDFGGIDPVESDPKIQGINEFKRSFGGAMVLEYNYSPTWIFKVEKTLQFLSTYLNPRKWRNL